MKFITVIFQWERVVLKLNDPKVGAITVVQRFGGNLGLNVHFHTLYMDGVFHENSQGDEVFYELIPSHEEVVEVTKTLKKRLVRLMEREEAVVDFEELPGAELASNSIQNQDEKFQKPKKIGKVFDPPFKEFTGTRCFYDDGFSLHANVKILGHLRSALEGLCRYVLRGPLAKDRISYDGAEKVSLQLKKPYSDGTTHLEFTPEQFIKRVIALIPPPRQNLIRYIGVFGARHKKRAIITGMAKPKKEKVKKKTYRTPWGELLKHVFKNDAGDCDHCGTKLVLIACITSRHVCHKILTHLNLPIFELGTITSRGPPEPEYFDEFPEYL
jgi:hypothetical protein